MCLFWHDLFTKSLKARDDKYLHFAFYKPRLIQRCVVEPFIFFMFTQNKIIVPEQDFLVSSDSVYLINIIDATNYKYLLNLYF